LPAEILQLNRLQNFHQVSDTHPCHNLHANYCI